MSTVIQGCKPTGVTYGMETYMGPGIVADGVSDADDLVFPYGFSLGKVLRDWINHCFFVTSVLFPGKTRRMAMLPYHFQVKKKCF